MRIGISVASSQPGTTPREGARNMIERAAAARQADLDSLFVGDHHVTRSPYYQNTAILPRMLAHWGDRPCGALYLLPLWHPVLLAEQIATMACIAEGPFIMQCGLGGESGQSLGMGVPNSERVGRFNASLALMRALWRGDAVNEARYWGIENARISPLPPEPIDVWVGAQAPPALDRTARVAQGWLASPSLTPDTASRDLAHFRQLCGQHQREVAVRAIRRDLFIGRDPEHAERTVATLLDKGYRGIDPAALMIGDVDGVVQQVLALARMGYTDVIVRNMVRDQADALACIERLGTVRALVRQALA